jgi:SET domain-containing protein
VKESKIQGRGVFAGRNFHKGEEILEINDSRVVKKQR